MTFVAGGALKPIGGHILSHASATRMFLRKGMYCAMTTDSSQITHQKRRKTECYIR